MNWELLKWLRETAQDVEEGSKSVWLSPRWGVESKWDRNDTEGDLFAGSFLLGWLKSLLGFFHNFSQPCITVETYQAVDSQNLTY